MGQETEQTLKERICTILKDDASYYNDGGFENQPIRTVVIKIGQEFFIMYFTFKYWWRSTNRKSYDKSLHLVLLFLLSMLPPLIMRQLKYIG